MQLPVLTDPADPAKADRIARLHRKAQELEASFLSQMLSHTGLDEQSGEFSGGIGEDQFSSFLRDEQAKAMVEHRGVGLSQSIFNALVRREDAQK